MASLLPDIPRVVPPSTRRYRSWRAAKRRLRGRSSETVAQGVGIIGYTADMCKYGFNGPDKSVSFRTTFGSFVPPGQPLMLVSSFGLRLHIQVRRSGLEDGVPATEQALLNI